MPEWATPLEGLEGPFMYKNGRYYTMTPWPGAIMTGERICMYPTMK